MYWKDNHGDTYGPFSKQEDGFPNAGQVVRFYRERMGLTQKALAARLGIDRQQVINMEKHNGVPQNLSRRRVIADLLNIPPVLLGISVIGSDTFLDPVEAQSNVQRPAMTPHSIQEASDYLDAAWDLHRFTGSLDILAGVQRNKARIAEQVSFGGSAQKANLKLLHRYEYFLLVAGKSLQDYTACDPGGLIDLARQIDDPDIIGISLDRRGKLYDDQRDYQAVLRDIREAVAVVKHASPQMKGFILASAGPILAHQARDKADASEVFALLDEAEKYIDSSKNYLDPFRSRLDESHYFVKRASALTSLLHLDPSLLDEVFEALDQAQECTLPQYMQRRADIEFLYADAAFQVGDYPAAVAAALEALQLARSIHSVYNIKDIHKLSEKLAQTKLKDASELRGLRLALVKKSTV